MVFSKRPAPAFSLVDAEGKTRTLAELLAAGPLVVVFYPGDFTPVCTKQLCSYRDADAELRELGVQVVGISADPPEKHRRFAAQYGFRFPLLSDPGKKTAKAWGATSKWMLGAATRANFVVSRAGEIVAEHVDGVPITHHRVHDLSETLRRLRAEQKL